MRGLRAGSVLPGTKRLRGPTQGLVESCVGFDRDIRFDARALPVRLGDRVDRVGAGDQGDEPVVEGVGTGGIRGAGRLLTDQRRSAQGLQIVGELLAAGYR